MMISGILTPGEGRAWKSSWSPKRRGIGAVACTRSDLEPERSTFSPANELLVDNAASPKGPPSPPRGGCEVGRKSLCMRVGRGLQVTADAGRGFGGGGGPHSFGYGPLEARRRMLDFPLIPTVGAAGKSTALISRGGTTSRSPSC